MEVLTTLLPYVLPLLATLLTILVSVGVKKLIDKFGLDRTERVDDLIDKYVGVGINYAEVMARSYLSNTGDKMPSLTKKQKATKVVMNELKKAGVLDVTQELVSARIESWLEDESDKKPGRKNAGK